MTEAFCPDCLKAAHMRRKAKKHIERFSGKCAECGHKGELFLKSDYSYHGPRTAPVRTLPEEKVSLQKRDWPEGMRFD